MEQTQGQIAAEIRRMLGEPPIETHNFTPANQRRRIESMQQCAADASSDTERHDAWIRKHESEGWTLGDTFDAAEKTHPNLVPWEQLPKSMQCKARIFDIVAKAGQTLEAMFNSLPVLTAADREIQNPPDLS